MTKRLSWHGPAIAWQDGTRSPGTTRPPLEEEEELKQKLPTRDSNGFRSETKMLAAQNAINRKFWEDRDADDRRTA